MLGFVAGFFVATLTAPVGVSGAVFLLPIQMSLLGVPNPQVTPTNLMYNVISGPGALLRYGRQRQFHLPLLRRLLIGCVPGVVLGAVLRVYVLSDPSVFRLLAAAVLLPTGVFILRRPPRADSVRARRDWSPMTVSSLAFVVGVVGGMYGIGGGSILGPLLVGSGMAVTVVSPVALASTLVTSVVGVGTFAVLAFGGQNHIAPDWAMGLATGLGGLLGGYVGAALQPRLSEVLLRRALGVAAVGVSLAYLAQVL